MRAVVNAVVAACVRVRDHELGALQQAAILQIGRRPYYRGLRRVTNDSGATSNSSRKNSEIQSLTIRH